MSAGKFKEQQFQLRERAILDAALALFADDSWQSVTVETIAERVGIAKGTIYKHFLSKEQLYARIALDYHRLTLSALEQIDQSRSVEHQIADVVAVFWQRLEAPKALQRVVQYCSREDFLLNLDEPTRTAFQALDSRFATVVEQIIQRGIEEKVFRDRPLPNLLLPAQAAMVGAIEMAWRSCLPAHSLTAFRDELTAFILAGMKR